MHEHEGAARADRADAPAAPEAAQPTGAAQATEAAQASTATRTTTTGATLPTTTGSTPRSSPAAAGRRFSPLLRRRGPLLEENRVDPVAGETPDPAATSGAAMTVRNPVATGFLLTSGVFLALAIVWLLQTNLQLIVWIAAALFIALGLDPIVRRIESWGAPRWVGVLAATAGLAAVAAAFIALLVPTVVEQSTQLVADLPGIVDEVMGSSWFLALDREFQIQDAVRGYTDRFTSDGASVSTLFGGLVGLGQTVLNALFSTLIVVVLTLYFLSSLPHMKYWAYRLAPRSKRPRVEALAAEITSSVGHYVMGQSVVAAVNATVAFIAMSVAGTPFAALLAFFAAIMAFIPLVGAVIGGTVITLVSLMTSWETAALFAAIYFVYLQVEAYVLSPRVMARAVSVPAAVGVIAVIAGGTVLGVLGALMAIPTAAALLLILREVFIPRQDAR